ncbi:MAG: hypothetical protein ACRDZ4_10880 [Egibacteraceae bacterium]
MSFPFEDTSVAGTGPAGPAGPAGAAGAQGPAGPPGQDGTEGEEGSVGPPGATGATGATGTAGAAGATGSAGAQGPPGADGEPGEESLLLRSATVSSFSLPIGAANDLLRFDGSNWVATSLGTLTSTGSLTAKGPTHVLGTVGTATTFTSGAGSNATSETSTASIKSGGATTAGVAKLRLLHGTVSVAEFESNGADTTLSYAGLSGNLFILAGLGGIPALICDVNGAVNSGGSLGFPYPSLFSVGTGTPPEFGITAAGVVVRYNAIATVSNGVPAEYVTVDLTSQSAAIGGGAAATTVLYAVPAAGAGMYRISWYLKVTTAASVSSTLGALTVAFTDASDSVAQVFTAGGFSQLGSALTTTAFNTTGTALYGSLIVNAKASTNITYGVGYTSAGGTAMVYEVHMKVEVL